MNSMKMPGGSKLDAAPPSPPLPRLAPQPAVKPFPRSVPARWPLEHRSFAATSLSDIMDRSIHAALSKWTSGLSPAALANAYFDWITHLACAPGKQAQLIDKAFRQAAHINYQIFSQFIATDAARNSDGSSLPQDHRFSDPLWQQWPYNFIHQSFLMHQQWWHSATTGVRGVTAEHERVVEFVSRQLLDMFSPANFIATNPEILKKTWDDAGMNLVRGFQNFLEDSSAPSRG